MRNLVPVYCDRLRPQNIFSFCPVLIKSREVLIIMTRICIFAENCNFCLLKFELSPPCKGKAHQVISPLLSSNECPSLLPPPPSRPTPAILDIYWILKSGFVSVCNKLWCFWLPAKCTCCMLFFVYLVIGKGKPVEWRNPYFMRETLSTFHLHSLSSFCVGSLSSSLFSI